MHKTTANASKTRSTTTATPITECRAVYYVDCDVSILGHYHLVSSRIAPAQAIAGLVRSTLGFLHNSLALRFPFCPRAPPPPSLPDEIYNHVDGNRNTVSGSGENGAETEKLRPRSRTPCRQNFFPILHPHRSLAGLPRPKTRFVSQEMAPRIEGKVLRVAILSDKFRSNFLIELRF